MNAYFLRILLILGAVMFVALLARGFDQPWWIVPAACLVFVPYGFIFVAEPPLWPWLAIALVWQVVGLAAIDTITRLT